MKSCTNCKEMKPLELYGLDKRASDGRTSRCRECLNRSLRERFTRGDVKKKHSERGCAYVANNPLARRRRNARAAIYNALKANRTPTSKRST